MTWLINKRFSLHALLIGSAGMLAVSATFYNLGRSYSVFEPKPLKRSVVLSQSMKTTTVAFKGPYAPAGANTAAAKTTPAAAPKSGLGARIGFSAGDLPGVSAAELEARLKDMAAMGVHWIRFDIPWSDVQAGGPGSYNWAGYDRVVAAAKRHGLQSLMIIDYTPVWARRSECAEHYKCAPQDPAQFAAYAAEVTKRYVPQGVTYYEIWNEPNMVGGWYPTPDAAAYVSLLSTSYTAIKAVTPQAKVLSGGTGVTYTENGFIGPADWMRSLYTLGAKASFDIVAQHPYTYPALATHLEAWTGWYQMLQVRSVMEAYGDSAKQVWLTEYGAPTQGSRAQATLQNFKFEQNPDHVDETLQSEMVSVALTTYSSYSWAGPLFWYGYKDLGTDPSNNELHFGLIRHDGSHKLAYDTLKKLIQ